MCPAISSPFDAARWCEPSRRLPRGGRLAQHLRGMFRRPFSTLLKANGEDVKVAQELLRHAHDARCLWAGGDARQAAGAVEAGGNAPDENGSTPGFGLLDPDGPSELSGDAVTA